ncbi:MAG: hypothetical protein AVDCRST_MAG05-4874, partial [uncultured Rubrobacteraceae bacterium]
GRSGVLAGGLPPRRDRRRRGGAPPRGRLLRGRLQRPGRDRGVHPRRRRGRPGSRGTPRRL